MKDKYELIKRDFGVVVPRLKGSNISWTLVEDNIVYEMEECKFIGISGFDYKLFEEDEGGGGGEGLDGYPYLKHIIQFWPGYWVR